MLLPGSAPAAKSADPDCLRRLSGIDLQTVSIPELQTALENGTITSVELVRRYIDRVEAFDRSGPRLNSVRMLNKEALKEAVSLDAERAGYVRMWLV
jgi:amidase